MLKNENISHSEEKTLSAESIEKFYQVLIKYSFNKEEHLAGMLHLVSKSYLEHVLNCFKKLDVTQKWTEAKKRNLLGQIEVLIVKNFFENKVEQEIITLIKQDILQDGKLMLQLSEEEREDILSTLKNIKTEIQAASITQTIPEKICTGFSPEEKKSITYSNSFQYGLMSRKINDQGIKHSSKREWKESITAFQTAIAAEENIPSELTMQPDEANIAIYYRNLAYAYSMYALELDNNENYTEAIANYQAAIDSIKKVPSNYKNIKDKTSVATQQRNLCHTLNLMAIKFCDQKKYDDGIKVAQDAVNICHKIPPELVTEKDTENTKIFHINLAYLLNQKGDAYFTSKNNVEAIKTYTEAIAVLNSIESKNKKIKSDIADYQRNLSCAVNGLAIAQYDENKFQSAIENCEQAIKIIENMDVDLKTKNDEEFTVIMQKNLRRIILESRAFEKKSVHTSSIFSGKKRKFDPDTAESKTNYKRRKLN